MEVKSCCANYGRCAGNCDHSISRYQSKSRRKDVMADLSPLIPLSDLKTHRIEAHSGPVYSVRYQPGFDALFIFIVPPERATIVHYLDNYAAFIYEDETLEIVGIQIEAFER